ncbi:MAG: hypothetical protein ACLRXQ_08815 [Phascolarctobacterium faecium]
MGPGWGPAETRLCRQRSSVVILLKAPLICDDLTLAMDMPVKIDFMVASS